MEPNTNRTLFEVKIDETCKEQLRGLSTWAKIIVVTSIISLVVGLVAILMPKKTVQFEDYPIKTERVSSIGGYIFTLIITLLLAYFLYQFSIFTKKGIDNLSQPDLNTGLSNLKSYFKTYGILVIIALVFIFLFLLVLGASNIS
jgi:hypothetical protein